MQLFRKQWQMLSSSLERHKSLQTVIPDLANCGMNVSVGTQAWVARASAVRRLEDRFATSTRARELGHSNIQVTLVTEARLKHAFIAPSSVHRPLDYLLCLSAAMKYNSHCCRRRRLMAATLCACPISRTPSLSTRCWL